MREPVIVAKECPRCETEFLTRAVRRGGGRWGSDRIWYERIACPDCHDTSDLQAQSRQRAWLDAHLAELRAATLRRREGRTCAHCAELIPLTRNLSTQFCSLKCYRQAHRVEPALVTKECEECGEDFQTTRLMQQRFCTMRCQERDSKRRSNAKLKGRNRERLGDDKPCDMCGRTFAPKTRRHRWCSYRCRIQAYEPKTGVLIEPRAWRKW